MIYSDNMKVKIESYQILQNLSKDSHEGREYIINYKTIFTDAIESFKSTDMNLVAAIGSFLRNITYDRELVGRFKHIKLYQNLVDNYFDSEEEVFRVNVYGIIANLVRDKDTALLLFNILDKIFSILSDEDNEKVLAAAAQIIRNASDGNEIFGKKVLVKGGLKTLVELCINYENPDIQENAVCAIRNLSASDPLIQEKVTNIAGIQAIINLLKSTRPSVQAYAAWAIRSISTSNDNINKIVVFKGLEPLVKLCGSNEKGVYEHAIAAVSNIVKGIFIKYF